MKEYTIKQIANLINYYMPNKMASRTFYPNISYNKTYITFSKDYSWQMEIVQDNEKLFSFNSDSNNMRYVDYHQNTLFGPLEKHASLESSNISITLPDKLSDLLDDLLTYMEGDHQVSQLNINTRAQRDSNGLYKIISCDSDPNCPFNIGDEWYVYAIDDRSATILIHQDDLLYTDISSLPIIEYKTNFLHEAITDSLVLIRYHQLDSDKVYNAIGRSKDWYPENQEDPRASLYEKLKSFSKMKEHLELIQSIGNKFYDDFSISDGTVVDYDIDFNSQDGEMYIIRNYTAKFTFAREFTKDMVLNYLKTREDIKFSFELEQIDSNTWKLTGKKAFKLTETPLLSEMIKESIKYTYKDLYNCVSNDLNESNSNSLLYMNYSTHIRMFFDKIEDGIRISFHPDNVNFPASIFIIEFFGGDDINTLQYNTSPISDDNSQAYYKFITDLDKPIGDGIDSILYNNEMEFLILEYLHHHQ